MIMLPSTYGFLAVAWAVLAAAQTTTPAASSETSSSSSTAVINTTAPAATSSSAFSEVPNVYLNVPELSVGRIELDVDDLTADINLHANVANLVSINAGVAISIKKVNVTIADVEAQLELQVRLGHLVDIVNRDFESLDLNPLLLSTIGNLEPIIGVVDGLLGSITQGGTTLNFLIDNLGNIVQEVGGVSTIVGGYLQNMTETCTVKQLENGLTQKTFSYEPLSALVDIVFNAAGQVVQAVVDKGSSSTTTTAAQATATAARLRY